MQSKNEPLQYRWCVYWALGGILAGSIPLSSVLALYVRESSKRITELNDTHRRRVVSSSSVYNTIDKHQHNHDDHWYDGHDDNQYDQYYDDDNQHDFNDDYNKYVFHQPGTTKVQHFFRLAAPPRVCQSDGCPVWKHCGGVSSYTFWVINTVDTIRMDIDTSGCAFNQTPLYFATMSGTSSHWSAASYRAIYYATKTSFTVFATSLDGSTATTLMSYASTYAWDMTWFGAVL